MSYPRPIQLVPTMGFCRRTTALFLLVALCTGCSPFHYRIPSECVTPKLLDHPRDNQRSINFLCLRQDPSHRCISWARETFWAFTSRAC